MKALEDGRIGYTEALGMMSLRERIARHYADHYGIGVPVDRVVVTTGSSGAFILAFIAMFDPGARVAISAPGYPAYRNTLSALGLEPVDIETHAAGGWVLTPEAVEMAHRDAPLAGVLAMSPANPSGTVIAMLMVEDPGAVAVVDQIADLKRFSVLACGIGSLTQAMGGDRAGAEAGNQKVLAASKRVGIPNMLTANSKDVEQRVREGFLGLLGQGTAGDEMIAVGRKAAGR